MPKGTEPTSQYGSAVEALRSTARWLLAVVGGVGTVLVGGLQLTVLGELSSESVVRLTVAIAALAGVVAGVGYMVREAARILTAEWVTLAHFDDQRFAAMVRQKRTGGLDWDVLVEVRDKIDNSSDELYGHAAPTLATLHRALREANEKVVKILDGDGPSNTEELASARARVEELRSAAREVVDFANYQMTQRAFNRLKPRLAVGTAAVVSLVTVFALAANPPPPVAPPLRVEVVSPTSTTAATSTTAP